MTVASKDSDSPLTFQVLVDPTHPSILEGAVSFETRATRAQLAPGVAYEHHGEEFSADDAGALTRFYEDLILGVPMPLTLSLHKVEDLDAILATALFLHRDLTLHPNTTGLVSAVDLIHRRGPAFYGHVDEDLARFLHGLQDYLGQETSKQERGVRIGTAAQWIREYVLDGTLPNLGPHAPRVRVLDVGTNGFVLAESDQPSPKCWEVLYRLGFLRGVVLGPLVDSERRTVLVSKKSSHVQFDLARAALHLNELEVLSGGDSEWEVSGEYLTSPTEGSVVLANYILQVLLRV